MLNFTTEELDNKAINTSNPIVRAIIGIDGELYTLAFGENMVTAKKEETLKILSTISAASNGGDSYLTWGWRRLMSQAKVTEDIARFVFSDKGVAFAIETETTTNLKLKLDTKMRLLLEGDLRDENGKVGEEIKVLQQAGKELDKRLKGQTDGKEIVVMMRPTDDFIISYDKMLDVIGRLYQTATQTNDIGTKIVINELQKDPYIKTAKLFAEVEHYKTKTPYQGYVKDAS